MNWSAYSRYVGDVFGGPLAMEGLAAFFLESTFLGLWLFGWDRLSRRVHLFCIWMVALGSSLSAAFIMAANSWMQHPVGYKAGNPPRLDDIGALFTNPVFLWGYLHVLLAALATGALVMLAVSAWQLRRDHEGATFTRSAALSISVLVPVSIALVLVGSQLGVIETTYQPMKIAAAEAQWNTCQPCSFSAFQIRGGRRDETPTKVIAIPHLLSILATLSWNGQVKGLNQLQAQYQKQYGPGNYVPNVFIQYWSMRVMAYLATAIVLLSLWGAWLLHRRRLAQARWFLLAAVWSVVTPFLMNTAGWMLTENGRQPWIVQGLMKTANGASPSVSATEIWISIGVFAALYAALGAIDLVLMLRYSRRELPVSAPEPVPSVPALTY
jgi:cytochrome d ubiquinol oxidase subunit I